MAANESEIPLVGQLDDPAHELLLAKPVPTCDRRFEDWLASNLDEEPDPVRVNRWNQLIGNLPMCRGRAHRKPGEAAVAGTPAGWSRFNVAYRRGITVVRLVGRALVDQAHIQQMGADLMELIDVGNARLVINFTAVERLGSWIIGVIGNAHRRCAAGDGGKLKICGLDPGLAEIFAIVGMAGELEFHPDEAAALDSPWPLAAKPRQLPVDILSAVLAAGGLPPLAGGAPTDDAEILALLRAQPVAVLKPQRAGSGSALTPVISLQLQAGSSPCRTVAVSAPRFLIGRDRPCHVRLGSAQVSKQHAALEQRDGRIFLRDLGSTNGTLVGGQHIRDQEVELHAGDQFKIGPVLATLQIGSPSEPPLLLPKPPLEWAGEDVEPATLLGIPAEAPATVELPIEPDLDPAQAHQA